jgi:hypothetical protein
VEKISQKYGLLPQFYYISKVKTFLMGENEPILVTLLFEANG